MRLRNTIMAGVVLTLLAFTIGCDDSGTTPIDTTMETPEDSVSYAIGVQIAQSLTQLNNTDIDVDLMAAAIKEALADEAKLTPEQCQQIISADQIRSREKASTENLEEGQAFLEENGKKSGVITTASGLQYKHLQEGTGESPTINSTVTVHYTGKFLDGEVFDSSLNSGQPIEFPLTNVIRGWQEGVQLLKPGGKIELYVPSDIAYGPQGRPGIPPNATLIFEIELISFK
ncbi:MAG: FKBP-type peptidyl-prolyl cis-trans isomerase [Roseivirga sp.]